MPVFAEVTVNTFLSQLIADIGAWVTAAVNWIGDFVGVLTDSGNVYLYLFCIVIPLTGIGIGYLGRLLRRR